MRLPLYYYKDKKVIIWSSTGALWYYSYLKSDGDFSKVGTRFRDEFKKSNEMIEINWSRIVPESEL